MADSNASSGFPWASLAVLAAFVASTQLVPRAFEPLRPAEKERAQVSLVQELPIDARLWEDPFTALRRVQKERDERCDKQGLKNGALSACKGLLPAKADAPPPLFPERPLQRWKRRGGQTLLLAVLVPGNPFVGAEEARRRTRYAVLTGLMSQQLQPSDSEHMGLAAFDPRRLTGAPLSAEPQQPYLVPYEMLRREGSDEEADRGQGAYQRVLLLWVDESALPRPKLDALARLMQQAHEPWDPASKPSLAVIGPSSTEALRTALREIKRADSAPPPELQAAYGLLQTARFFNAASTVDVNAIPELEGLKLGEFLSREFKEVTGKPDPVTLTPTIAKDRVLLERLATELKLRLPERARRRVILVTEHDSAYGRSLLQDAKAALLAQQPELLIEPAYYFRGLDGVTTREAAPPAAQAGKAADPALAIEWPEARDQLDYLRRLTDNLKASDRDRSQLPIAAIGVFGFDVHDKLLVLQAMHDSFADRLFFTTDMDARFLHPRALPFTRNLVVASSLPLALPAIKGDGVASPSFRDVYQSAAYLAARQAACQDEPCRQRQQSALETRLAEPPLFEIGRSGAVPLFLPDAPPPPVASPAFRAHALIAGGFLLVLHIGLIFWPSTPALRSLCATLVQAEREPAQRAAAALRVVLASVQLCALVFVNCSVIAFLDRGAFAFPSGLFVLVLTAAAFALALMPLLLLLLRIARGSAARSARPKHWALLPNTKVYDALALVFMLILAALIVVCAAGSDRDAVRGAEPLAWFEGISAWPTQLLQLLALMVVLCALDQSLDHIQRGLHEDADWLALPSRVDRLHATRLRLRELLMYWPRPASGSSCFVSLWSRYRQLGDGRLRAARIVLFFTASALLILACWWALNAEAADGKGGLPGPVRLLDLPVRGEAHRNNVLFTMLLLLGLLPLSIVMVADATLLAYKFVMQLSRSRCIYPPLCLQHFAKGLGTQALADLWCQPMALHAHERGPQGKAPGCHSLLDDWIGMQLVARRTSHIAPLVMGPFVVLGILLLARSRMFDNWPFTPALALSASAYLLVLILLGVLLKNAVETARRHALERMEADLRWLKGLGDEREKLVKPFEGLIAEVRTLRGGALAGLSDQPLLKALLIPLGGAGGAQLLDYLSLLK